MKEKKAQKIEKVEAKNETKNETNATNSSNASSAGAASPSKGGEKTPAKEPKKEIDLVPEGDVMKILRDRKAE